MTQLQTAALAGGGRSFLISRLSNFEVEWGLTLLLNLVAFFVRKCSFSYFKAFSMNSSKPLLSGHDAVFSWLL